MNEYKIELGVSLNTSDLKDDVKALSNKHKLDLGINLNDGELKNIKKQLTNLTDNTHRIRVDIDNSRLLKQIEHAKKELRELNNTKGNKPSLDINTKSLEASMDRVTNAIDEIRKSLGSIDDTSGIKSLVTSVNQIATALGKAENESDSLIKSLSALSKKDFSVNVGLNMGKNSVSNSADYGDFVRENIIPQFEAQAKQIDKLVQEQYAKIGKRLGSKAGDYSGSAIGQLMIDAFGYNNYDEYTNKFKGMYDKSNMSNQLIGWKNYFGLIEDAAKKMGISLSSVMDGFSADKYIQEAREIRSGTKEATDQMQTLKTLFGGGINADNLNTQLDSIVTNLNEIKTALQGLSSKNPVDGLTSSFDRLSGSIEKLLTNAEKVKGVLGSGLPNVNVDTGVKAENIVPDGSEVVQSAQQVGTKIGDSIEQGVRQSLDLDEILDQQTLELMETFSIAGDKGSKAFAEIRQAIIECRNDLQKLNSLDPSIDEEVFDTSRAFDKVSDAIANQLRTVNSLGDEYIKLAEYMKGFNDPKKGNKVRVPDFIKQEQGDDYKSSRGTLGIAFNTEKGISFASFIEDLNHELGIAIDLTKGEEKAYEELVHKLRLGREQLEAQKKSKNSLQATASTDEILAQNYINKNEIRDVVEPSLDYMDAAEATNKAFAQISTQTTNIVVQNNDKLQQSYRESSGVIDNLKTKLESMKVDRSSIDTIIKDVEELGFTAKSTSVEMKNGKFDITVNGIDDVGRAITELRRFDSATEEISLVSRKISQPLAESDKFIKQQKKSVSDLTNQINQLNRVANDQNANRPIKDSSHLDALEAKYNEVTSAIQRMEVASSDTFVDEQNNVRKLISEFKSLVSEFRNAENVSNKMKGTDFASGLDIAKNDLERFKAQAKDFPQITQTIKNLDEAIENVDNASSLNKFNDQLKVARSELAKIKSETIASNRNEKVGINVSGLESKIADLRRISPEIDRFEAEIDGAKVSVQSLLNDLKKVNTQGDFSVINSKWKAFTDAAKAAGIAVTDTVAKARTELAKGIKADIDLGNYANKMDAMEASFNQLYDASERLNESYRETKVAYREMINASEASTGDEVADRERLIQAQERYIDSLQRTNNLIRQQARIDSAEEAKDRLAQSHKSLESDMVNWLKNNSKAAKEYGETIENLIDSLNRLAKADNLKQFDVNSASRTFKNITKDAETRGLTGLKAWDRLVSKVKEYSVYVSAAEIFMWVEQGLRDMFNTVKEIDTAMTGLYRVTDLTTSQYDTLFKNMISSAKEYGATLNDIINATTDWVRAGFDADTSLGLAEVTTMYQHISDLDYDTAAENLITAYNGFKDELNGAFSGDTVAAVEYIADIFNQLDNEFAVTSAGLGEALTRSASALDLAGNTIQQTAGMVTGIVEVTQDPEQAGSTLKILSLRLRGKRIMPPYKESLYALFGLKYGSSIEDNYICQNARVA